MLNEADGIVDFIAALKGTAHEIVEMHSAKITFIFVDDGSTDRSAAIIADSDFTPFDCQLVIMSRNFGKEAALTAGLHACDDCDAAIMIDADLEHPPKLMLPLVTKWRETGADSIYYFKSDRRQQEGFAKSAISKLFYRLMNFGARVDIKPDAGDYRLINRQFLNTLCQLNENQRFMKGLYSWIGFKQIGLPFTPATRRTGKTSFSLFNLILLALDGLTSFTTAPLRLMMIGGLLISTISFFYGAYIIIEALFFPGILPGIASTLTLISLFGGLQLLCLGILGEYVGRALYESKNRPAYIVRETLYKSGTGKIISKQTEQAK